MAVLAAPGRTSPRATLSVQGLLILFLFALGLGWHVPSERVVPRLWLGPHYPRHGKPCHGRAHGMLSLRALPPELENFAFSLSAQANGAVGESLQAANPSVPALLPLLFLAGVASSINPCSAAALPAAVASTAALGQGNAGGVLGQAAAFALGSGTVLAGLCLAATALGEQLLPLGELQWLFPCIAVLMGLGLLGVVPLGAFGKGGLELPGWVPRELQGFALGMASALGSSPCATPVLVTVISYLATHPQAAGASPALFLSYAMGYNAPLALVAMFAGVLPVLQSSSRLGPLLAGGAILSVGTFQLVSLGEERGLLPAGALAAALVVPAIALLAGQLATRAQQATREVVPVMGEPGVYLHRPAAVQSVATAAAAGLSTNRRIAAVAAVALGGTVAGSSSKLRTVSESPVMVLRGMAARSRPLSQALRSGRPVVVDFSAGWCRDCLALAPALHELEERYSTDVEFVTLDVSSGPRSEEEAWWLKEFRVDGIPHVAFIDPNRSVLTALVGDVPPEVIRANIEALRSRESVMPFAMYDAFEGRPLLFPPADVKL